MSIPWTSIAGPAGYTWLPETLVKERDEIARLIERTVRLRAAGDKLHAPGADPGSDRTPWLKAQIAAFESEIGVRERSQIFIAACARFADARRKEIAGEIRKIEAEIRNRLTR